MIKLLRFLLPLLLLLQSCTNEEEIPKRQNELPPNIVFILADDLGWADLPSYGNLFNEAPNIDRLRAEGMQFMNAYAACPVCSPTRASIQAGQYPTRVGIIDFITGHWRPFEELIVPKNRSQYLPDSIITIGEALRSAGYATGYFGKWHLGFQEKHLPGQQGYDEWKVHRKGTYYQLKARQAIHPEDPQLSDSVRLSEALTDYGIEFMERHRNSPFFLFLAHYDVHVQLDADQDLIEKYLNKPKPENYPGNALYAGMVEHIDRSVGRIMAKLEELNLEENTLVIFFSDNGGLISRFDQIPLLAKDKLPIYEDSDLQYIASSNFPLRAEKGTVFEGGIREPLIVRWPKKIKAGTTSRKIISSVDFYPTLVEIAQGKLPPKQIFDGVSFVGGLEADTLLDDRPIYWHYPVYHHDVPASAIRIGPWKLIHFLNDEHVELYELTKDIEEKHDLSKEYPDRVEEMMRLLDNWRLETTAEMPVRNPNFDAQKRKEWGIHPDRRR